MRILSPRTHGVLDYLVGGLLIAAPRLLGFADHQLASQVPVLLGVAAIFSSLLTAYPLGLLRVLPFRLHLRLDLLSGVLLASSPWLFGFADRVWVPHLAVGLFELGAVMLTRRDERDEARPASARRSRSRAAH
jgi:hypothetical protein